MSDILESGSLEVGILVDGVVHREFSLRPSRLADTYRAAEIVPVPSVDNMAIGSYRTAYQMAIDDAVILCQLVKLGGLDPVPDAQVLVEEVEPGDMEILRAASARVKKKLVLSRNGSSSADKPSASSSEQGSA